MKMKLFAVLAGVALACSASGARAQAGMTEAPAATQAVAPSSSLSFLVLGDWGNGSQQQKDVAEAMARYADAHPGTGPQQQGAVRFVVLTGDNFYESGVKGVGDPQWQEKFEKVYDKKLLDVPFYAVLGNHDWVLDPLAEILYSQITRTREIDNGGHPVFYTASATRWQMDGFWYRRSFGGNGFGGYYPPGEGPLADFFFIDTDLWTLKLGALADKQMAWLEDGLKNSKAKWQLVVAHHPLYSDGEHGREGEIAMLRDKLSPLFQKWGMDAYLCGHDHDLEHIEIPGHPTSFVISGAGGKLRPRATQNFGPFYASTPGFVAITLTPESLQAQVIDFKDRVLHEWQRPPALPQP